MSNTYAKIKTSVDYKGEPKLGWKPYKTDMILSLTAFVGGDKHTQLTVTTKSTNKLQSGTGYIQLGDNDVDMLIAALMERKLKVVTATGNEQSIFCPDED